jgi:hypothetical protein
LNVLNCLPDERIGAPPREELVQLKPGRIDKVQQAIVRIAVKVVRHLMAGPVQRYCQDEGSARFEHPMHFLQSAERFGNMFHNLSANDAIESRTQKRKLQRRGDNIWP